MRNFPFHDQPIRLAMLGMVDGNGHPYSWSAILNGFDPEAMRACPYPVIPEYLEREPPENLGVPGVQVTHIWTDNPDDADKVAAAAHIPNVAKEATDVIGEVDAVLIATDRGEEHVARCRAFVEAGIPVFIDKPLTDNPADLRQFNQWVIEEKRPVLSSSCMRYAKEFLPYRQSTNELGALRYVSITTPKSWLRYGIHALEGIYAILGPGFQSARNTGRPGCDIVHFTHKRGIEVVVAAIEDMFGSFGVLTLCGTAGHVQVSFKDSFFAFREQLLTFIRYLRSGTLPFPYAETEELMRMVIAGTMSREQEGAEIQLARVLD